MLPPEILTLVIVLAVFLLGLVGVLLVARGKKPKTTYDQTRDADDQPQSGGVAVAEEGEETLTVERPPAEDLDRVEQAEVVEEIPVAPTVEKPEPVQGRLARLRARLVKTNNIFGKGLLSLLSTDDIDEDVWDEIEETLLLADLGTDASMELVDNLRDRVTIEGSKDPAAVKQMLREELIKLIDPTLDRSLDDDRLGTDPSVMMVVGVNGVGKTTTVGKLARVLVAEDKDVILGAADTFRAAAAEQLTTWGARIGVPTVRSDVEGADPASVAFDAVAAGVENEVDVVLVDTAGRLQNKAGLMDELGKIKRVIEKKAPVREVLLVIDATTGQNGLSQAKVFSEAVNVTGIVLTKLDGTAKGGIVVAIQRQLGVPVKLIGLGEGADDLAPFETEAFVEALLAE
ncbi:signal recognition particle-docking protein FtsY [Micrococcoides hystricis]|uniref:Signal recognition particle receptor FtsY n=1 Tax=Micrococcoides hystricis TaxID=1572761 RepID=A0ABV6PC52_9MICC